MSTHSPVSYATLQHSPTAYAQPPYGGPQPPAIPPLYSRHPSQSDSDVSDGSPRTPSGLAAYDMSAYRRKSPLQIDTSGSPAESASPDLFGKARLSPETTRTTPGNGAAALGGDDDSIGPRDAASDFAQTFYDPFRIKHRRRTSPSQLKVLEFHFDRNPKPDVALRKSLSEQLDMTPREVQVWFQNRRAKTKKLREKAEKEDGTADAFPGSQRRTSMDSHWDQATPLQQPTSQPFGVRDQGQPTQNGDYSSLRRGSSPAIMSSSYYQNVPPPPVPQTAQPPSYNYPPPPSSQFPSSYHPLSHSHPAPHGAPAPPRSSLQRHRELSVGQSPYSSPHSASDATDTYSLAYSLQAGPPPVQNRYDDGGRRFSLPAYPSSYAPHHPSPTSTNTMPSSNYHEQSDIASQRSSNPSAPPTSATSSIFAFLPSADVSHPSPASNSSFEELAPAEVQDLAPPPLIEYPYQLGSGSSDVIAHPSNYDHGAALNAYSFGSSWRPAIQTHSSNSSAGTSSGDFTMSSGEYSSSTNTSPIDAFGSPDSSLMLMHGAGGRRSSCPAGFLPTFDNLALSSPTSSLISNGWSPSSGYPAPLPSPSQGNGGLYPFTALTDRRGSTPSLLGTIAEQAPLSAAAMVPLPPQLVQGGSSTMTAYEEPRGGSSSSSSSDRGLNRKSRSQINLRTAPYPPSRQTSGGGPHERRGSAPGLDYGFTPSPPMQQPQPQQQQAQQEYWPHPHSEQQSQYPYQQKTMHS